MGSSNVASFDELPAELRRVISARIPTHVLAAREAAFNGSQLEATSQLSIEDPPGLPMSVPGDGSHSWADARRLLADDADRQHEFRRRVDEQINAWLDDHRGLMPTATRDELIENARYWMQYQLQQWQRALDDHKS